jgi:hypothetical protein
VQASACILCLFLQACCYHRYFVLFEPDDQAFTLLCHGRVKMASVKTFQLVTPDSGEKLILIFSTYACYLTNINIFTSSKINSA